MTELRTERLLLRPLRLDDAPSYAAMRFNPAVAEWLPTATQPPLDAARAAIGRFADAWRDRGYSVWGLFRDGALIGHGGLNHVAEFAGTEVLWALHPDAWGKGYASELARAALAFGFERFDLPAIFAITKPDNRASRAVMERCSLSYRSDGNYKGFDVVYYDIDRASWLKTRRDRA
ncbi:MAG: GNAT family N-acetyltransferase [Alphaproteobacteria bacterium]|nr:GNAT family N-acetyltransferase [Alphaproteobacteria bacterium]